MGAKKEEKMHNKPFFGKERFTKETEKEIKESRKYIEKLIYYENENEE